MAGVLTPPQREGDEDQIRRQIHKIIDGLCAKDLETLKQPYAPDIMSFDIEPPLRHVGLEAKLQNWAKVFALFDTVTYEIRDLTLTVGEELAFGYAFGRLGGTLPDATVVGGMWVRLTYCLQKVGGVWLIVHDQVSVPLDVATGKGVVDLEP
jgi:ketosteroid isomerase-like protein